MREGPGRGRSVGRGAVPRGGALEWEVQGLDHGARSAGAFTKRGVWGQPCPPHSQDVFFLHCNFLHSLQPSGTIWAMPGGVTKDAGALPTGWEVALRSEEGHPGRRWGRGPCSGCGEDQP